MAACTATGCFFGIQPSVELAAGGSGATDEELPAIVAELSAVAEHLAPQLAYAFISIESSFDVFSSSHSEWSLEQDGADPFFMEQVCDEYVFDAYHLQVLGPGHLNRLGRTPPGARQLDEGRVELAIGDASDWVLDPWLPGDYPEVPSMSGASGRRRNQQIKQTGRRLLEPCLLKTDDAFRLLKARDPD